MDALHAIAITQSPWAFGWDGLAALGTIAATVAAVALGAREMLRTRRSERAKATLALVMLWPDLRRFKAALASLRRHDVLLISGSLSAERLLDLNRIRGSLSKDLPTVVAYAVALNDGDALAMARVVANVRHALRHTDDITIADGSLSTSALQEKQAAIRTAIGRARVDLKLLLTRSVHLKNQSTEHQESED